MMFKRKVLYLGGFDPRGARFYHQLQGEQVAAHNAGAMDGESSKLHLSSRRREHGDFAWTLTDGDDAHAPTMLCETRFLAWDDLVRKHWPAGGPGLIPKMLATYWRYARQGEWAITGHVPRGSKLALLYPGLALVLLPLACTLAIALVLALATFMLGLGGWLVATLVMAAALAGGLTAGLALAKKMHAMWLLRFIMFNDMLARHATDPALDERLDRFAATIAEALDEAGDENGAGQWDEVLFVTHSNGSILAMLVMARLIALRGPDLPGHFALVTLGGSIQLVCFRHDARDYHVACDTVAHARFAWLDIGSLTDGASIPLIQPLLGRPVDKPAGLVQLSPRWFRYCEPATYKARRRDKYMTHFDYLRRLDRPSPLDFLGITASTQPLATSIAEFEAQNG
jgi:hypothetical protein